MKIEKIKAREILDSRGNPTLEVKVEIEGGIMGKAKVPSGASTGAYEAWELRDNDEKRYLGKGVLKARENVNGEIQKALKGESVLEQEKIDKKMIELDGTKNKSRLGANAILGVSLAVARAAANSQKKELAEYLSKGFGFLEMTLPVPMMNIINGGRHADSGLDVQEFMIVPYGFTSFKEALRAGAEIFHKLKEVLKKEGLEVGVGDEGGFAPKLKNNQDAFQKISEAIEKSGYDAKTQVGLAVDVASSEFYDKEKGTYLFEKQQKDREAMFEVYKEWTERYPVLSIEDGLGEDDWEGWSLMKKNFSNLQIVGDDFLVTNPERVKRAIEKDAVNAVLIKLNQIGTLTETLETIRISKNAGWRTVISHRSGETDDTFISDLAVGVGAEEIKSGSLSRSERIEKYNRILELEEEFKLRYNGDFLRN
jgi:enolase